MDTAKPQNPCTDLSEIRRWGAEGWEKGFAVSLFVSKVPRHINEKNNRNKNKEGKERGIKMDTQQMFQELDHLYAQGKLDEAEEKMMCNEMEGLYRNTGRVAQAVDMADMALSLIAGMGLDGSIHHGTTLLNAATARRMAGDVEKALSQYREAEAIFKNLGKTDGYEMASLYNNISQIYQEQEEHEKALESLDKALELIKKMENSEAEVATTHVNRALSLMALGRLDEADEELKESLTFYASPEGVQSGHFGSALAAAGELAWRRGNYDQAIGLLEKALMVTQSRFGESDACAVIRQNLEMIKKEKEEKGITGDEGRTESTGGKQSHCASCQFKDAKF